MRDWLPAKWSMAELGDVVTVCRPRSDPRDVPDMPFVGMDNVEAHTMRLLGTVPAGTMRSKATHFFPEDVLYGRLRPYLNKVLAPAFEGLASAEFIPLTPESGIDRDFVRYRINAADFVSFTSHLDEGDRPRVDWDGLRKFKVSLPPTSEQRRIVDAIESYLTRLDDAIASLQRVQAKLKAYRTSVLKAAVEGRLVPTETSLARSEKRAYEPAEVLLARILRERRQRWEEAEVAKMRAAGKALRYDKWKAKYEEPVGPHRSQLPELPQGWTWATLDQLSVVVRGASPRPAGDPRYFGGKVPWITVGSLTADEEPYLRHVSEGLTDAGRRASRFVEAGTLLLTNSGATLGVPKITLIGGCINDGSVALLHVQDPMKLYLYFFLRTLTQNLRAINQGAAQPNLNTGIVRKISVPVPPIAEQSRITADLERLLSVATATEADAVAARKRVLRLRQAILKWAFEGKLTDNDPNDEPADMLLDRIKAERAVIAPKTRSRRRHAARGAA